MFEAGSGSPTLQMKVFKSLWTAAMIGFAVAPAPVWAKPLPGDLAAKERATILTPASPWQLDGDADRCVLARKFTSEDGPGLLAFEQFAPGPRFDLTMAAPTLASERRGYWFYGGLRDDWPVKTISPIEFDLPGYGDAATLPSARIQPRPFRSASISMEAADLSSRVVLQRATTIVSFETGPMRAPFAALNECAATMLDDWDLDRAAHQEYTPARMPSPRTYFARLNNALLADGVELGEGVLVRIKARVEGDGKVTRCRMGSLAIQDGALPDICADITDMTFEPAVGANGETMPSLFSMSIRMTSQGAWNAGAHGGRWGG